MRPRYLHPDALRALVGSATKSPIDANRHALLLRAFKGHSEYNAIRSAIMAGRAAWLDWLTVTQRKWQAQTRRPSRARHHDSIRIREKYVRGNA